MIYLGKVTDTADEKKLGRVKVEIISQSPDDLPDEEKLWAWPLNHGASLNGVGVAPVFYDVGTIVAISFLDKHRQHAFIIGSYCKIPENDEKKHDVAKVARGENDVKKEKIKHEPDTSYGAKYPNNKTITTKRGHVIEIDDTPDAERIHVFHRSGTYLEIAPDGRLTIKGVKDVYMLGAGKTTIYSKDKMLIETDSSLDIKAKTIDMNASGEVTVKGSKINLN